MTKHLIKLVRIAARSYRVLVTLTECIERVPMDRLATAIDLFIQWAEAQAPPAGDPHPDDTAGDAGSPFIVTEDGIEAGQWMSRREAWLRLGIVKSTLEGMIRSGELAAYHKSSDRKKKRPYVWLRRSDVEELYRAYTLRKGKER